MPVCNGSTLMCSMGTGVSQLLVTMPENPMKPTQPWPANILDGRSLVNIKPFGMCRSMANPQVAAASAAAQGALIMAPCIPNTTTWAPGDAFNLIRNAPALNKTSQAVCTFGGIIKVTIPVPMT